MRKSNLPRVNGNCIDLKDYTYNTDGFRKLLDYPTFDACGLFDVDKFKAHYDSLTDAEDFFGTCASLIIAHHKGKVVGFQRSDGHLGLPCGKNDPDEYPIIAAQRELFEETGIEVSTDDLKLLSFPCKTTTGSYVYVYTVELIDQIEPKVTEGFEHEGHALWMDPIELLEVDSMYQPFNYVILTLWELAKNN